MNDEDKLGTPSGDAADRWVRKLNPTEPSRLLDVDTRQLYNFCDEVFNLATRIEWGDLAEERRMREEGLDVECESAAKTPLLQVRLNTSDVDLEMNGRKVNSVTLYRKERLPFNREDFFGDVEKPFYEVSLVCRDYAEGVPDGMYILVYSYTLSKDGKHLKDFDTEPPQDDLESKDSGIINPEEFKIINDGISTLNDKLVEVLQPPAPQS